jgi:hypothetical protein
VLVVGDTLWAIQAAAGTWAAVMSSNATYPAVHWIAATAVYVARPPRMVTPGVVRTHAAALTAGVAALGLLVANAWADLPAFSVVLAGFALLSAIHRSALALATSVRQSLAAARERELVDEVRFAMTEEALELHFQPLVDTRTGTVSGAEALLRWTRDGVNVPPDRFLPAVERSELMRPLTDYVLEKALAQVATWGRARRLGQSRHRQPRRAGPARARARRPAPPRAPALAADARDHRDRRDRGQRDGRERARRARPASRSARSRSTAASCARCTRRSGRSWPRRSTSRMRSGCAWSPRASRTRARCGPCASSDATSRRATTSPAD